MFKDFKKKSKKIVVIIFLLLSVTLFIVANWLENHFGNIPFEQYLFHLFVPLDGASNNFVLSCIKDAVFPIIFFTFAIQFIFHNVFNLQPLLKIKKNNRKITINIFPFSFIKKHNILFSILIFLISLLSLLNTIGLWEYLSKLNQTTEIYENYFVDPNKVNLNFPKNKKNLILIYLESIETSFSSIDNGGLMEESYTRNLDKIANNNIKFSNLNGGGYLPTIGTSWTIAGLSSTTTGLPLKISVDGNSYGNFQEFLPNAVSLGDVLKDAGYNQTIMIGSDIAFGGRDKYYSLHGDYNVFDYNKAIEDSVIDSDYYVWWGFEDRILFKSAKDKLNELSQEDEPFNFTMLTVDTHAFDGYQDPECEQKYDKLYSNAIACSDEMVNDFIDWIKKQDFYKDTTIVIIGDHLSMDYHYFEEFTEEELSRRAIYNAFINPFTKASNTTNRTFTAFDIYPSILASMGVEIEGDKLALGVNLFSDEQTIPEQIGLDKFNEELQKRSIFYNDTFIYNRKR